jgi:hypothetical protein
MPVPIETRHVEAILALAEELNFTRAATRLNLVQSTLSRQIDQVEGIVGFPMLAYCAIEDGTWNQLQNLGENAAYCGQGCVLL